MLEKVKEYNYPVCFDFPVGHQKNNFALKCGVKHLLEVSERGGKLVSDDTNASFTLEKSVLATI